MTFPSTPECRATATVTSNVNGIYFASLRCPCGAEATTIIGNTLGVTRAEAKEETQNALLACRAACRRNKAIHQLREQGK